MKKKLLKDLKPSSENKQEFPGMIDLQKMLQENTELILAMNWIWKLY